MINLNMLNSGRFLDSFNKIHRYLRKVTGEGKETSFSTLVSKAGKFTAVKYYSSDLKEFADLRNAIVHESTDGHVIAEPNDAVVRDIERIASVLLNPPKVIPLFQREVLSLKATEPIGNSFKAILDKSFSQIPIYDDQRFVALLSVNTVARWLGASVEDDVLSLSETIIANVLEYHEDPDNYCFLSRNSTIFEVLQKFQHYEKAGKMLEAILITENGKPTEIPLGIVTIWDIPQIYRILGEK